MFVEYGAPAEAAAAGNSLGGRLFASRVVAAEFVDEGDFAARKFD